MDSKENDKLIGQVKKVMDKLGYDEFFIVAGKNAIDYANGLVDQSKLFMGGDTKGKVFFKIIPPLMQEAADKE